MYCLRYYCSHINMKTVSPKLCLRSQVWHHVQARTEPLQKLLGTGTCRFCLLLEYHTNKTIVISAPTQKLSKVSLGSPFLSCGDSELGDTRRSTQYREALVSLQENSLPNIKKKINELLIVKTKRQTINELQIILNRYNLLL